MRKTLLGVLVLLAGGAVLAQSSTPPVGMRLSAPTRMRVGAEAAIKVFVTNPHRDERVTLTATATYSAGGSQVQSTSSVDITVDRSLDVSLAVGLGALSLVDGSPTFDGSPVNGARGNGNVWTFNLNVPGDGKEHALELRVIR